MFSLQWVIIIKWEVNKDILAHLLKLFKERNIDFSGNVSPLDNNYWELSVCDFQSCKYLCTYFDNFTLKSNNKDSYNNWKKVIEYL